MPSLLQKQPGPPPPPSEAAEEDALLNAPPTADDYEAAARRRSVWLGIGGFTLAALAALAFAGTGLDNIVLPLVLLLGVMTPILLWRFPRLSLYVIFAAVCLFEMGLLSGDDGMQYKDALTDRIPFFWNVNTIFQVYAHADFKGVPLNLMEIFVLAAGVCSTLRAVYTGTTRLRAGALFVPIIIYMAFVGMAEVNGVLGGGDFKISLQEVRSQFYFLLAYLMAVNMVRLRSHVLTLLWIFVGCVGLKGLLYTFRRYVTLHGLPLPDQGVGSHEEAFLFDLFALLLIVLVLCRVLPKMQWVMLTLLPLVITGNLACNRRAATAAMVLAVPVLLAAAYQALPDRRRMAGIVALVLVGGFSIYYPAFKNSDSLIAQPARAIRSNFQPDARDASSNASRDAENANLMATVHSAPVQGIGYGRRYLHVVPMADISKVYPLEDYLPHNQVLWVWERVGTLGFLAFWGMISAIFIFAGQTVRAPQASSFTKVIGLFTLLATLLLVIFGMLDLQLSNFRDVLFVGIWVGVLAALPMLDTDPAPSRRTL